MQTLSNSEVGVVEAARARQAIMLEQVQAWAKVNSGSRNLAGLAKMADLLSDAFSALPGTVAKVAPATVEAIDPDGSKRELAHGQHLHICVRPEAPIQLILTGHMDTVFGEEHSFQSLAWLDEETLNGPGVADMKGGLAVMLSALLAIEGSEAADYLGYDIVINADEEVGSLASADLLAEKAAGKRAALTYEPAALPDGTLAGARPGSGNFSFTITGLSAHAGRNPKDGRNALIAAADLALRLKAEMDDDLSVNPAKIDGGSPNNVVPDHAVLRVNMRPRTPEDQARAQAMIERHVSEISRDHDVQISTHGHFARPPKPLSEEALALFGLVKRAGEDLGQTIAWKDTGGVCDGNNIAACGVPVVDTMGVCGGKIHSDEEFLLVSSLGERAALSALTIHRLAMEGAPQ